MQEETNKEVPMVDIDTSGPGQEVELNDDAQTENQINRTLNQITKNKTTITVTHKLNNIIHADQIILFSKGKVEDIGKHDDLIKKSKLYKKLYETSSKS